MTKLFIALFSLFSFTVMVLASPESQQISLNGTWRFTESLSQPPVDNIPDTWQDISVPAEWRLQGYHVEKGATAGYARFLAVPATWSNQRVKLHFGAVHSDCTVYVNGQKAGSYMGAYLPFEFDITDFVKFGSNTNLLVLQVKNESIADDLAKGNHYAKHPIGGILRDVTLEAIPLIHIAECRIDATLNADLNAGQLHINIDIANESRKSAVPIELQLSLRSLGMMRNGTFPDSKPFKHMRSKQVVLSEQGCQLTLNAKVDQPLLWHAEQPNLYELRVILKMEGKETACSTERFGFRTIEVRGNELFINNAQVKLRGVARHVVHPLHGRALPSELLRQDVQLFRAANCNLIRTSHYPPEEELLDLCDAYGLFVIDEAPFCWVYRKALKDNTPAADYIMRATQELFRRDRNHPSIIIWSQANESTWQAPFEASLTWLKKADPSRPVMFSYSENYGIQGRGLIDIGSYHYPGWEGPKQYDQYFRPILFDEALHLNAYNEREFASDPGVRDLWGGYIQSMWQNIRESQAPLGIVIWGGIDEIFFLPEGEVAGYGLWGIIDGWRRPKPEYWHTKKSYSPFHVTSTSASIEDGEILLPVENRYDVSSFDQLAINWSYGTKTGTIKSALPAGTSGVLKCPVGDTESTDGLLQLNIIDAQGFAIDREVIRTRNAAKCFERVGSVSCATNDPTLIVRSGPYRFKIQKETGKFTAETADGQPVITKGPELMLLPVDNNKIITEGDVPILQDDPTFKADGFFSASCQNWICHATTVEGTEKQEVQIKASGSYDKAEGEWVYTFKGDGRFDIDYFFNVKTNINPRQTGLVFEMPNTMQTLKWDRKGIWSCYPPDHIGRLHGETAAFYSEARSDAYGPRTQPSQPWSQDATEHGSNDFRSTKHHVFTAQLSNNHGQGLRLLSDGRHHIRCWIDQGHSYFLAANYSCGGGEHYLRRHTIQDRRPLEKKNISPCKTIVTGHLSFQLTSVCADAAQDQDDSSSLTDQTGKHDRNKIPASLP